MIRGILNGWRKFSTQKKKGDNPNPFFYIEAIRKRRSYEVFISGRYGFSYRWSPELGTLGFFSI
jgi:hypothetical protein